MRWGARGQLGAAPLRECLRVHALRSRTRNAVRRAIALRQGAWQRSARLGRSLRPNLRRHDGGAATRHLDPEPAGPHGQRELVSEKGIGTSEQAVA